MKSVRSLRSNSSSYKAMPIPVPSTGSSLFNEMSPVKARMRVPATDETSAENDRYLLVSSILDIRLGCPPKKRQRARSREGQKIQKPKDSKVFQPPFPFDDPTSSSSSEDLTPLPPAMMTRRRTKKIGFIRNRQQRKFKTSKVEKLRFDLPRKKSIGGQPEAITGNLTTTAYDRKMATPAATIARRNSISLKQPLEFPTKNASKFFQNAPFCFALALSTPQFPIPHPEINTHQPTIRLDENVIDSDGAPAHAEKSTTSMEIIFSASAKSSSRYPSKMCSNLPMALTPKTSPEKLFQPNVVTVMDMQIKPIESLIRTEERISKSGEKSNLVHIQEVEPVKKSSFSRIVNWLGRVSSRTSIPVVKSEKVHTTDDASSSLVISPPEFKFNEGESATSHPGSTEDRNFLARILSKAESLGELLATPSQAILGLIPRRVSSRVSPEDPDDNSSKATNNNSNHSISELLPEIKEKSIVRQDSNTSCSILYHRFDSPGLARTLSITHIPHSESTGLGGWKTGLKKHPGIPGPVFPNVKQDEASDYSTEDEDKNLSLSNPEPRFSLRNVFRSIRNWVMPRKKSTNTVAVATLTEVQVKEVEVEEVRVETMAMPKPQRRFYYKRKYIVERTEFIDHVLISESRKRLAVPRVVQFQKSNPRLRVRIRDSISESEYEKGGQGQGMENLKPVPRRGRDRDGGKGIPNDVNANLKEI